MMLRLEIVFKDLKLYMIVNLQILNLIKKQRKVFQVDRYIVEVEYSGQMKENLREGYSGENGRWVGNCWCFQKLYC